MTLGNFAK